jgi:hypothetical protein
VIFRNTSYHRCRGTRRLRDVLTTNPHAAADIYGVANLLHWSNDVFTRNPRLPEATEGAFYQNEG